MSTKSGSVAQEVLGTEEGVARRGPAAARSAARMDRVSLAILVVAVALRVAWVLQARVAPIDDTQFYYDHATELATGQGYIHPVTGEPSAFLPPGYPSLLGLVFVAAGPSTLAGAMLNVGLAAAGLLFAYLLARQYFGVGPARLALLVLALFPSQIVYAPALLPDILFTTLAVGVLWVGLAAGEGTGRWRWLTCGLLLGAAILTAPKALLLLPVLLLAWKREASWRLAAGRSGLVAVAMLAVLVPWTVRNAVQLGEPVFVSTNSGVNLWIGNNPEADGGWMPWDPQSTGWTYPTDEVAADRDFLGRAIDYALTHPRTTVSLWPDKLTAAFAQDFAYLGHFSLVTRDRSVPQFLAGGRLEVVVNWYYTVFVWAALASIVVLSARRHQGAVLVLPLLALAAPIVIFFALDRYHVSLLPLLAILLAGGAGQVAAMMPCKHLRP